MLFVVLDMIQRGFPRACISAGAVGGACLIAKVALKKIGILSLVSHFFWTGLSVSVISGLVVLAVFNLALLVHKLICKIDFFKTTGSDS